MNKLVASAVVGGTALVLGVLPVVSAAAATVAPTTSAPSATPAHPALPTMPSSPTHNPTGHGHKPSTGGHKSGGHRTTTGHHTGGHTSGGGVTSHKPSPHKPKPPAHLPSGTIHIPSNPPTRIIGGKNAAHAPWAAQVQWDGIGFECSGAVVAPQWVLTAQHCVNPSGMTVLVGSPRLGEGTAVAVDGKKLDPAGDMALLHLAQPVTVPVAKLADADPEVGSVNDIYGWGKTGPNSGPSPTLKTATVRVTGVDCTDAQHGKAICSTGIDGTAFNGDSGGAEMADGVEVGVCSTGDDAGKSQYASVAASRDWLRQTAEV